MAQVGLHDTVCIMSQTASPGLQNSFCCDRKEKLASPFCVTTAFVLCVSVDKIRIQMFCFVLPLALQRQTRCGAGPVPGRAGAAASLRASSGWHLGKLNK